MLGVAPERWTRALMLGMLVMLTLPPSVQADTSLATWYGSDFQGQTMYNGERYNMYDPTIAASNSFPIGTWARVTSLNTGRSVDVQVRDRGAFSYAFDLSYAAFHQIDDPTLMEIPIRFVIIPGPGKAPVAKAAPSRPVPSGAAGTYMVQPGDTLSGITAQTGVSETDLASWNNLSDPNALAVGQQLRLTTPSMPILSSRTNGPTYVVKNGDTLSGISAATGVPVDQLAAANGLTDPNALAPGQILKIGAAAAAAPSAPIQTYVVQAGDTLSGIAQAHNIDLSGLEAANGLTAGSLLQIGEALHVPG